MKNNEIVIAEKKKKKGYIYRSLLGVAFLLGTALLCAIHGASVEKTELEDG